VVFKVPTASTPSVAPELAKAHEEKLREGRPVKSARLDHFFLTPPG
jgi:hypothetical protein